MRTTIHLVSARDYWPFALAVREGRREWWLNVTRDAITARSMSAAARKVRARLEAGALRRKSGVSSTASRPRGACGHTRATARPQPA
jgi:hypothetical protein